MSLRKCRSPTLVLAHNKTLAAQLYQEFKQFFPDNAVEYFVSYYDYYQPEAFIPTSGTYIEKDLSINEEIEKLRLSTTSSLLSGRRDVIVVASVSCLVWYWKPGRIQEECDLHRKGHGHLPHAIAAQDWCKALYSRTEAEFNHGNFRIKGDTVDIYPSYADNAFQSSLFWR